MQASSAIKDVILALTGIFWSDCNHEILPQGWMSFACSAESALIGIRQIKLAPGVSFHGSKAPQLFFMSMQEIP